MNISFVSRRTFPRVLIAALLLSLISGGALFGIAIPSDGSDGAFSPAGSIVVDLSLAPTATWYTPGAGNGVYDPAQWAVVFI